MADTASTEQSAAKLDEALRECVQTLEAHPGYHADVTFAAIWNWLARKDEAVAKAASVLAAHTVSA